MSASAGTLRATKTVLGTPGLAAVKRVLLEAITTPVYGKPGLPNDLFLAHRYGLMLCRAGVSVAASGSWVDLVWEYQMDNAIGETQFIVGCAPARHLAVGKVLVNGFLQSFETKRSIVLPHAVRHNMASRCAAF